MALAYRREVQGGNLGSLFGVNRRLALAWLARQLRTTHQEFIHRPRALPTFADRPHHERLTPAHVAGGEDLRERSAIVLGIRGDVASRIAADRKLLEEPGMHGPEKAHREQHEIGF